MTAVLIDHSHRRKAEPLERRTYQFVRRKSRPVGRERRNALTKQAAAKYLLALEIYQEKLRKPGQRWGAEGTISHGAIGLYKLLLRMSVKFGGKVEPSAAWLAQMRNVPVRMIHVWKAQLKAHGFLEWDRRYLATGRQGIRGPQVEQTSNAYRTKVPAAAAEAVERLSPARSADMDTAREERWRAANPELAAQADRLRNAHEDRMARQDRFRSD